MNTEADPAGSVPAGHRWRFFRAGDFDRSRLETGYLAKRPGQ